MKRFSLTCLFAALGAVIVTGTAAQAAPDTRPAPAGVTAEQVDKFNGSLKLIQSGDFKQACQVLESLDKELPDFKDVQQMYAVALMQTGRYAEALALMEKQQQAHPDEELILVNLGTLYRQLGQTDKSADCYRRYLKVFPKGEHAVEIKGMLEATETELARTKGSTSSKGKEDYLLEAVHTGAARWRPEQMPIPVYIAPGAGLQGYKEEFNQTLKDAFVTWAQASGNKLSFRFTSNPAEALIKCAWADDPAKMVDPSEGGEALPSRSEDGRIGKGSILLLTHRDDKQQVVTDDHIKFACLHEVGHIIGLFNHSSQPGDIMFSMITSVFSTELSNRDRKTILALYAAPESFLSEHPVSMENAGMIGHDSNPRNKALKLNAEGVKEAKAGNYQKAIGIFQQGVKLFPELTPLYINMGNAYSSLAYKASEASDVASAENYLNQAIECFVKSDQNEAIVDACNTLIQIAKYQQNAAKITKYEAQKRKYETGK